MAQYKIYDYPSPSVTTKNITKEAQQFFKKIIKIYKTNYAKLLKSHDGRIFSCSASLLKGLNSKGCFKCRFRLYI